MRADRGDAYLALARTLLAAYNRGYNTSDVLSEALGAFQIHHQCLPGNARTTLDFGEALYADHRRAGRVEPLDEILGINSQLPPCSLPGIKLDCQYAKVILVKGAFTNNRADISKAKEILDKLGSLLLDSK